MNENYFDISFQYKDAFLNANPDFKWYKLPAPPLRTLSTRPTNKKADTVQSDTSSETIKSDYLTSSLAKLDEDSIQPGKLADESQIGGLSSLFTPEKVNPKDFQSSNNPQSEDESHDNPKVPKPPKKCFVESSVSAGSKEDCKADLFGDKKKTSESNNNNHHLTVFE